LHVTADLIRLRLTGVPRRQADAVHGPIAAPTLEIRASAASGRGGRGRCASAGGRGATRRTARQRRSRRRPSGRRSRAGRSTMARGPTGLSVRRRTSAGPAAPAACSTGSASHRRPRARSGGLEPPRREERASLPLAVVALEVEQPGTPAIGGHPRPLGRDELGRRLGEVTQRLPVDGGIGIEQPLHHGHGPRA
jgi:hypothetical protein